MSSSNEVDSVGDCVANSVRVLFLKVRAKGRNQILLHIRLIFSVYNCIPLAQVRDARVTRPFNFLKGLAAPD